MISGNTVTVPASFKDYTDVKSVTVTASYGGEIASYVLPVVNWGEATFADEFSGTSLDTAKWGDCYERKSMTDGNTNRLTSRNCYVENGHLVMPVVYNSATDEYEGADVNTQYTFNQRFGCYTVRMKQPNAASNGGNNAFWLMPAYGGFPRTYLFYDNETGYGCNEIDVVERSAFWKNNKWNATLHYYHPETLDHKSTAVSFYTPYDPSVNDGYIEYTTAWTPDAVYIYVNGAPVWVFKNITPTEVPAYMRLSNNVNSVTAATPAWTGYTLPSNLDQLTVYVDYVRVYAWN